MPKAEQKVDRDREVQVACPRCGYDQRGVIAAWTECCDLQSTCTECGLRIEWAEVLSEKRRRPWWCVEYAKSWRQRVGRTLLSAIVPWCPWYMWRSLKMTDPPRMRKLVLALGIMVCLWTTIACATVQITAGLHWREWSRRVGGTTTVGIGEVAWGALCTPLSNKSPGIITHPGGTLSYPPPVEWTRYYFKSTEWRLMHIDTVLVAVAFNILLVIFSSCAFLALPISRERARVRWVHIWRMMLYGLGLTLLPLLLIEISLIARAIESTTIGSVTNFHLQLTSVLSNCIVPIVAFLYLHQASKHYLRMQHSMSVAVSMFVIGFGLSIAVLFYATHHLAPPELWRSFVRMIA